MRADRLARRATLLSPLVLVVMAALPAAGWAAPDDLGLSTSAETLDASPGTVARVLALGRRVVQGVVDSERAVVNALTPANTGSRHAQAASVTDDMAPASAALLATRAAVAMPNASTAADPLARGVAQAAPLAETTWRVLQGDADSHVPCVAWMADVQPVTGVSLLGGNVLRPSMHLSAEWALDPETTVGLMPGVAVNIDPAGRRTTNGTLALTVGKRWAPGVRTFVDVARERVGLEPNGSPATTMDAGFSVSTGPASQLEIAVTHGLTPAAPAFEAGVGVSSSF